MYYNVIEKYYNRIYNDDNAVKYRERILSRKDTGNIFSKKRD